MTYWRFMGILVLAFIVMAGFRGCPSNETTRAAPPQQTAAVPAPEPKVVELTWDTLPEAVDGALPLMSDEYNALSPGAVTLGKWAMQGMHWVDLRALPRTRRALVMKSSEKERGKVICASGSIIEIQSQTRGDREYSVGGIFDDEGGIYRFLNVGSTGELVEHSRATLCGVVIGRFDYQNSMNGTAHAIQLVGMFDLPENRKKSQAGAF